MIRALIHRKIDSFELALGESLAYVRHIANTSLPAFFRFNKIFAIAGYRKFLPAAAYHVGRIVAARDEDCGTCVQIEINLALKSGLDAAILRAVVEQEPANLPEELSLVYRFVESVVKQQHEELELREQVKSRYGDAGLVELALAIGASRFLPIVKRTLGYGTSCSQIILKLPGSNTQ